MKHWETIENIVTEVSELFNLEINKQILIILKSVNACHFALLKKSSCYFRTRKTRGNPRGFSNSSRKSASQRINPRGIPRGI